MPDVTIVSVNCAAGVAGDMLLGALVDAGADPVAIASALAGLGVDGYALTFERVQRGGIAATWANVVIDDHHDRHEHDADPRGAHGPGEDDHPHHGHGHGHDAHEHRDHGHGHDHQPDDGHDRGHLHRPAHEIRRLLEAAELDDPVRQRALRVFHALAVAEGAVHGIDPDDVEFHEVGSLDAIVDVVGVCAALQDLGIDRIHASPIAVGHGVVRAAHGQLPNPPPAVVRLLAQRQVPMVGVDTTMELSTPTGVAILVALADSFGAAPPMSVSAVGFGAGTADPQGRPNVVQVVVGETTTASVAPRPGRQAIELAVNVDDVTGEVLAHTVAALMAAGAHDAWATPIVMKKGRPAHTVAALVDPVDVERLASLLLAETGSLGLRATTVERWPQQRTESTVDVDGHPIRVKLAAGRVKVEHDDAATAAAALDRPLREVLSAAEHAARREA